jgi:hypothetical protein
MADRSITQLPVAVTPLTGNEITVIVQNGVTKQVQVSSIAALAAQMAVQIINAQSH